MKLKSKFIFPILLFSFSTVAQDETNKTSGLPTSKWSFMILASWNLDNNFIALPNEFIENLSPEGLTEADVRQEIFYPNKYSNGAMYSEGSSSPRFGFEYRFKEGTNGKDVNWSYRSDFQFLGRYNAIQEFGKRNTQFVDSAFVPSMNTTVYRDSIYISNYLSKISQQTFNWNHSILFRIAENKRFSFYSGVQFGIQFNFSRKFEVSQYDYAILDSYTGSSQQANREISTEFLEPDNATLRKSKLANTMSYQVAIPLGLDFRINDRKFWKHVHPFLEGTLGMNFQKNSSNINFYQNIGMRYKF